MLSFGYVHLSEHERDCRGVLPVRRILIDVWDFLGYRGSGLEILRSRIGIPFRSSPSEA